MTTRVLLVIDTQTYAVTNVGHTYPDDNTSPDELDRLDSMIAKVLQSQVPQPSATLLGPPAATLYAALTGHAYGDPPESAHPLIANHARALIQDLRTISEEWEIAFQCFSTFGPHIQPWLGVIKLDEKGFPQKLAPEYLERITL